METNETVEKQLKKKENTIQTVSPERRLTVQMEINEERGNRLRKTPADRQTYTQMNIQKEEEG